jgi:uncharacterized protein YjiS (DUF1127 family)
MSAILTTRERVFRVQSAALSVAAAIRAVGRLALRRLSVAQAPQWRSLNDRLLRDIGASSADAEIARLKARMGVSRTEAEISDYFRASRLLV